MAQVDQLYRLRSGLTLYPEHQQELDQLIGKLVEKVPAKFVLLTDVTGQVISARGEKNNIDLVALASLVAGDLAASQEIARLTGEYEDYQLILREGQVSHTFIGEAGRYLALMVQVSQEVPLGWARMLIKQVSQELMMAVSREVAPPLETTNQPVLDDENLSGLFDDALDDLWME